MISVISVLKESGLEFCELGGVKPNPRSGLVYEGIELCKKEKVRLYSCRRRWKYD